MTDLPRSAAFINAAGVAVCTGPSRSSEGADPAGVLHDEAVAVVNGVVQALGRWWEERAGGRLDWYA
jgi:hypothetical protein